jgi:methylmalonyl-CoA mutase C-terminal domain/subunit
VSAPATPIPARGSAGSEDSASSAIRVVVAKIGLDGHDRGAKVIARGLRDAGMEVIYTGLRRGPDELAEIVLQEDADVLGLSILSGAVLGLTTTMLEALQRRGLDDVLVIVGGIIPPTLARSLSEVGVEGAFGPGSSLQEIVAFTRAEIAKRRQRQ